jgi:hypothetical protein
VHAVFGANQYAVDYYLWDPNGNLANGLSLVHWTWALYDNYAQAYLWWIYLAGRLGGIDHLSEIFDLDTGAPTEVDALIAAELGGDMPTAVLENKIAIWAQQSNGPYSFGGLLSFAAGEAPTVPAGTSSLNLEPFGGSFFMLAEDEVAYPGTQGADIAYAGVDDAGNVDLSEPFQKAGGALIVYNKNMNTTTWPTEHSGPDLPAIGLKRPAAPASISPAWSDPPPVGLTDSARLRAWRDARLARLKQGR